MKKRVLRVLAAAVCLLLLCGCDSAGTPISVQSVKGKKYTSGDWTYTLLTGGTAEITGCTSRSDEIVIPDTLDGHTVTSLGAGAFSGCDKLSAVTVPDSVTAVGVNPFEDCPALRSISVSETNPALEVINGALFTKTDKKLIACPTGVYFRGEYDVPEGTQILGDHAFAGRAITSVTIPDSVTGAGANPFLGCSSLCEIRVSAGNQALAVIDNVLFSKSDKRLITYPTGLNATEYAIPQGVKSIGDGAFFGSRLSTVSIPAGVTSIGIGAFEYCCELESVSVPAGVTSLGARAFARCRELSSLSIPDSVSAIGEYAFTECARLTAVTIPDNVISLGDYAFRACESLSSVSVPASMTSVGANPFAYCAALSSVTVPAGHSALEIRDGVLFSKGDKRLIWYPLGSEAEEYAVPQGTKSIGDHAFGGCETLVSVSLPGSVTSLGQNAFSGCSALISLTVPGSVTSIGNAAFSGCRSLTALSLPGSISSIGEETFRDCRALTSVTVPGRVTSIGDRAFCDCAALRSVTLPFSVTSIGEFAFSGCDALLSVTVPDNVTFIGQGAFDDCSEELMLFVGADSCAKRYAEEYQINLTCPAPNDWLNK